MRKFIIDTDTASDDCVAILMALRSKEVEVKAITTVAGNVPLDLGTRNALMTISVADTYEPPLYKGSERPLMRDLYVAKDVHGADGMGDYDLVHPTLKPQKEHAVDKILQLVKENPYDIEIISIGPATNVALAMLKDPETMKKVTRIYSMGSAGFGRGNVTPVAEFNVFVDAEAYRIMLNLGIPITIIGWDVCIGSTMLNQKEVHELLNSGKRAAEFAMKVNRMNEKFSEETSGEKVMILADAVAMGVALWNDEILKDFKNAHCYVCIKEEAAYGQVIVDFNANTVKDPNAMVAKTIDGKLFKRKMMDLLLQ